MICPKCGENNPDGTNYCIKCGSKLEAVPNAGYNTGNKENASDAGSPGNAGPGFGSQGGAGFGQDSAGFGSQGGSGFGQDSAGFGSQGDSGFGAGSGGFGGQGGFGSDHGGFGSQGGFGAGSGGFGGQDGFGTDSGGFGGQGGFGAGSGGFGGQGGFSSDNGGFGNQGGFDLGGDFFTNPDGPAQDNTVSPPGGSPFVFSTDNPNPSDYLGKGSQSGKGGIPKPVLIAIAALAVVLILAVVALILDHSGVVKVPVIHGILHGSEEQGGQTTGAVDEGEETEPDQPAGEKAEEEEAAGEEPAEEEAAGEEAEKEEPDEKEPAGEEPAEEEAAGAETEKEDSDEDEPEKEDPAKEESDSKNQEATTLSLSVTDVEPPEMERYHQVPIKGLEAAPGAEGTSTSSMISDNAEVWRTEVRNMHTDDYDTVRMTFQKSKAVVIAIKAGNWTSPEAYNTDSRPTKIYLSLGDHRYPLSLSDRQVVHYIVFSNPVEVSEISMKIDTISNDTTGYFAITNISIYSE